MPCDYSKYPPNWKTEIRPRILARAGQLIVDGKIEKQAKCENCGVPNREIGTRKANGEWVKSHHGYSQIVLTIATWTMTRKIGRSRMTAWRHYANTAICVTMQRKRHASERRKMKR